MFKLIRLCNFRVVLLHLLVFVYTVSNEECVTRIAKTLYIAATESFPFAQQHSNYEFIHI